MKENAIQAAQSAQVSKKPTTMQDYISRPSRRGVN